MLALGIVLGILFVLCCGIGAAARGGSFTPSTRDYNDYSV